MTIKHIVILISVATVSCAIGYGITRFCSDHFRSVKRDRSLAVQYAMKYCTQKALKNKVFQMDKLYVSQYHNLCIQLCQKRHLINEALIDRSQEDPHLQQWIKESHQIIMKMERRTVGHILEMRDTLPEDKRGAFITDIQKELEVGHQALRISSGCCSTEQECKGSETK